MHLRHRNSNDNIIEFESLVLKFILNVDVTATSTFWWPTVNWEDNMGCMHDWYVHESCHKKSLSMKKDSLVKGMRDSSVLCILHFSTPKSLLRGKDLSWFFRPSRDSVVNSFLSTWGWVWRINEAIWVTPSRQKIFEDLNQCENWVRTQCPF